MCTHIAVVFQAVAIFMNYEYWYHGWKSGMKPGIALKVTADRGFEIMRYLSKQ